MTLGSRLLNPTQTIALAKKELSTLEIINPLAANWFPQKPTKKLGLSHSGLSCELEFQSQSAWVSIGRNDRI